MGKGEVIVAIFFCAFGEVTEGFLDLVGGLAKSAPNRHGALKKNHKTLLI
jgi:hypothetical protein